MIAVRRHSRPQRLARLLTGLLLLAALAPSLARGLAFAHGDIAPWSVLCTATGGHRQAPIDDRLADAQRLGECTLCLLAAAAPALPSGAAQPKFARTDLAQPAPRVQGRPATAAAVWAGARSRAPPPDRA